MKRLIFSPAENVSANIRKLREYRGFTQGYMAAKLDISQNAYSKMELGHCKLTVSRLFEIADLLELDVRDLIALNYQELISKLPKNIWPANL